MKVIDFVTDRYELLKKFLNNGWNVFLTILFFVLSLYTYFRIAEKIDNVRLYYNNTEQASFIPIADGKSGKISLVTKYPKKITFVYKAIDNEQLKPEDFKVDLVGIPSSLIKVETVFFEDENFLVLHLPYLGVKLKNKTLNYSIQSDKALLKYNTDGTIVNKQGGSFVLGKLLILVVFFPFVFVIYVLLVVSSKWKREDKFLVCSLSMGLILIFSRAPCSQFNDLIHFDTAYNMSNIILGLGDAKETGVLLKRDCDVNLLPDYYPDNYHKYAYYWAWYGDQLKYFQHLRNNAFHPFSLELRETFATKVMRPQRAFILSALTITLCRLMHTNQFVLFYAGVVVNFIIAVLMIYFSCKKNVYLKNNVILILSLFPVVLMEFGSYSYDALLLPVAFTLINYSIYIFYSDKKKLKDIIILAVLCVFIIPVKAVYFPLAVYFILTYIHNKKIRINLSTFLFLVLGVYVIVYIYSIYGGNRFLNGRGSGENSGLPAYSVAEAVQHPLLDLKILLNTFLEQPYDQIIDFFIPMNIFLKFGEYLFLFLFVCLFLIEKNDVPELYLTSFLLFLAVSFFIFLVGMSWTIMNSPVMWGVQPRYFIPVMPLLFIASERIRSARFVVKFDEAYNLTIILAFFAIMHFILQISSHTVSIYTTVS